MHTTHPISSPPTDTRVYVFTYFHRLCLIFRPLSSLSSLSQLVAEFTLGGGGMFSRGGRKVASTFEVVEYHDKEKIVMPFFKVNRLNVTH